MNYSLEMDEEYSSWVEDKRDEGIEVRSNERDGKSFSFDEFHYNLIEV